LKMVRPSSAAHDGRPLTEPGRDDHGAHQVDHQEVPRCQEPRHLPRHERADGHDDRALSVGGAAVGERGHHATDRLAIGGRAGRDPAHTGSPVRIKDGSCTRRRLLAGSIANRLRRFHHAGRRSLRILNAGPCGALTRIAWFLMTS
jgi:hypothetical protein